MIRFLDKRLLYLALVGLPWGWGCERVNVVAVDVAMVEVTPETLFLTPGGIGQLTARVLDDGGEPLEGRTVSWSSDDGSVATVSGDGRVTATGTGAATVTATSGGVSGTATVTVSVTGSIVLSAPRIEFETQQGGGVASQNVQVTNGGSGALTDVQFTVGYDGDQPNWLAPSLNQNTTPATLTVGTNAGIVSGLGAGVYGATIVITAANATNSPVTLPVDLTISTPDPAIGLSQSSRAFAITEGGSGGASQPVTVTNVGGGTLTGLAEQVVFPSGDPDWLRATLDRATAPATLTLTLRSAVSTLAVGVYTATVRVTSDVASNSPQNVAVQLTVGEPPAAIGLDSASVSFEATEGVDPEDRTVGVFNLGGGTLSNLSETNGVAWLTSTLASTTAPTSMTLEVDVTGLAPGTYNTEVSVASPVATNSPVTLPVSLTVLSAPEIVLAQSTASFDANEGGPGVTPSFIDIGITNAGEAPLDGLEAVVASYGPGASGWLTPVIIGPMAAPTTLRLTPTLGTLAEGTYTAVVEVTSPVANNNPQTVDVTLEVGPPASIELDRTSVDISASQGVDPANEVVSVTNGGGGVLSGLSRTIVYGAGATGWLDASSFDRTTAPADLTLRTDVTGLAAGNYTATVSVLSPVASNSPQDITVSLTVIAAPTIVLSRTSVALKTTQGSSPAQETVDVTNGGGGNLTGLGRSISYGPGAGGWLNTSSFDQSQAPAVLTLRATTGSLAPGNYTATVSVTSPVADNSPQEITVTLEVEALPSIELSRSDVSFSVTVGANPGDETVDVTNGGGGSLTGLGASIVYGAGATGWLGTSSFDTPTAPAVLTLRVVSAALAAGVYTATVSVTSVVADNSPQDIAVTLTVTAPE